MFYGRIHSHFLHRQLSDRRWNMSTGSYQLRLNHPRTPSKNRARRRKTNDCRAAHIHRLQSLGEQEAEQQEHSDDFTAGKEDQLRRHRRPLRSNCDRLFKSAYLKPTLPPGGEAVAPGEPPVQHAWTAVERIKPPAAPLLHQASSKEGSDRLLLQYSLFVQ